MRFVFTLSPKKALNLLASVDAAFTAMDGIFIPSVNHFSVKNREVYLLNFNFHGKIYVLFLELTSESINIDIPHNICRYPDPFLYTTPPLSDLI